MARTDTRNMGEPGSVPSRGLLRRLRRRSSIALALIATTATGAVYGLSLHDDGEHRGGRDIAATVSERFPAETLADWVTFGDQLSVVTVLDETELPGPPEPASNGDFVLRKVTLRIDRTLWQRPRTTPAPSTVSVRTWGWFEGGGTARVRHLAPDAPRLEVGRRYLTPLVSANDGWTPVSDASILTLDGDAVTAEVDEGEPRQLARSLTGQSLEEIDTSMDGATPYLDEALMTLDPDTRLRSAAARDLLPSSG